MKRLILAVLGVSAAFALGLCLGQQWLSGTDLREQGQPIRIVYPADDSAYNLKSVKAVPYKVVYRGCTYNYEEVPGDKDVIIYYGNGMKVFAKIQTTTFLQD